MKICPDFDGDCTKVEDHFLCWLGGENSFLSINGKLVEVSLDRADGYCPFVQNTATVYDVAYKD